MRLNGIIGAEIPYYKMMNKAMPGPAKDTKRKPKNGRLTEIDPKTNKPRLKSGVPISRAVEVRYMFENTDVLPYQIEEMKVTISNLQTRVKKLEDWQDYRSWYRLGRCDSDIGFAAAFFLGIHMENHHYLCNGADRYLHGGGNSDISQTGVSAVGIYYCRG